MSTHVAQKPPEGTLVAHFMLLKNMMSLYVNKSINMSNNLGICPKMEHKSPPEGTLVAPFMLLYHLIPNT
jgi:hypothetical protein